jgi:hypothetical protein
MKMSDEKQSTSIVHQVAEGPPASSPNIHRRRLLAIKSLLLLVIFGLGVGSGYLMWGLPQHDAVAVVTSQPKAEDQSMELMHQINPPEGYTIPAAFGDIGPQLLAAGAIDLARFVDLYQQQDQPLTDEQLTILKKGLEANVNINPQNSYFLLNFFWALGLTNDNPILTEGPMMSGGAERVGSFASTAGWTLGARAATELFASQKIITLTEEQQARLLEVASSVYRPCCNNPTHFPDCNHGMAMLGLLELMASRGASTQEMYDAAKYVTAFWYPQQMLEVATAFQVSEKVDFAEADSKMVVSNQVASSSGFQVVHKFLAENGLLEQAPSSGGSCGVK